MTEKMLSYSRKWRKENPEKARLASKKWKLAHPGYDNRPRKHERLAGRPRPKVCDVCHKPGGKKGISFDHCHVTGQFRGWLCGNCNSILGLAHDSPDVLLKLIAYLESRTKMIV